MGGKKKVVSPWLQPGLYGDWAYEYYALWADKRCLSKSFEIPRDAIRIRFVAGAGANSLKFEPSPWSSADGCVSGYGDGESYNMMMYSELGYWLRSIQKSHGGWHWVEVEVPS